MTNPPISQIPNNNSDIKSDCSNLYQFYCRIFLRDIQEYISQNAKLVLPYIPCDILVGILDLVRKIFAEEPIILQISGECVIIGDLHGQILDLFRILRRFGLPPLVTYLFLGDLVDRGEFSTETTVFVFLLKILYPKNIYIIRGNHEFRSLCDTCGFFEELSSIYSGSSSQMISSFSNVFSFIPLAALLQGDSNTLPSLCVHGGIGPGFRHISSLNSISRPITDYNDDIVCSLVWSDPSATQNGFGSSLRNTGYIFGYQSLSEFLSNNRLLLLIRGHECVSDGVSIQLNRRVITVFSASNYCGLCENKGGVLIHHGPKLEQNDVCTFPPLHSPHRKDVIFLMYENANFHLKSQMPSVILNPPELSKRNSVIYSVHRNLPLNQTKKTSTTSASISSTLSKTELPFNPPLKTTKVERRARGSSFSNKFPK